MSEIKPGEKFNILQRDGSLSEDKICTQIRGQGGYGIVWYKGEFGELFEFAEKCVKVEHEG